MFKNRNYYSILDKRRSSRSAEADEAEDMTRHIYPPIDDSMESINLDSTESEYYSEYIDVEPPRKKRSSYPVFLGKADLIRWQREIDEEQADKERGKQRHKREEVDSSARQCSSDITTLTVGCSTADRMEFQSDCVNDDFVTGLYIHIYTYVHQLVALQSDS